MLHWCRPDNILYLTTSTVWRLLDMGIAVTAGAACSLALRRQADRVCGDAPTARAGWCTRSSAVPSATVALSSCSLMIIGAGFTLLVSGQRNNIIVDTSSPPYVRSKLETARCNSIDLVANMSWLSCRRRQVAVVHAALRSS